MTELNPTLTWEKTIPDIASAAPLIRDILEDKGIQLDSKLTIEGLHEVLETVKGQDGIDEEIQRGAVNLLSIYSIFLEHKNRQ